LPPRPPKTQFNGGLRFDSQGAGTPNSLSDYALLSILCNERGDVFFAELYINWNLAIAGFPIHHIPPGTYIFMAAILVVEAIGILTHVQCQKGVTCSILGRAMGGLSLLTGLVVTSSV